MQMSGVKFRGSVLKARLFLRWCDPEYKFTGQSVYDAHELMEENPEKYLIWKTLQRLKGE